MERPDLGTPFVPAHDKAIPPISKPVALSREHTADQQPLDKAIAPRQAANVRRLVADQLYFGLGARAIPDRQSVPRPFSVTFHASEDTAPRAAPGWERLRDWGARITRRVGSR